VVLKHIFCSTCPACFRFRLLLVDTVVCTCVCDSMHGRMHGRMHLCFRLMLVGTVACTCVCEYARSHALVSVTAQTMHPMDLMI